MPLHDYPADCEAYHRDHSPSAHTADQGKPELLLKLSLSHKFPTLDDISETHKSLLEHLNNAREREQSKDEAVAFAAQEEKAALRGKCENALMKLWKVCRRDAAYTTSTRTQTSVASLGDILSYGAISDRTC